MKIIPKKILAIILVLIMALGAPAQVFAASNNAYIKDVKMVVASSAEEAKKLIGTNYSLLQTPIYEGAKNTYVAYQTTDNPAEAITDIRAMNMNGGWSYEKYKEYMDEQKRNIEVIISDLKVAIAEFRKNYSDQKDSAIYAYTLLNQYYEDDSQMTLAKFMLVKALEEPDRLFTLVLECNSDVFCTIERALMIGCQETLEGTFSERMAAVNAFELAEDKSYSAGAKTIISGLAGLQEAVYAYEKSGYICGEQSPTEILDGLRALYNSEEKVMAWSRGRILHDLLKNSPYKGIDNEQTLYDLFMGHVTSMGPNNEIIADFSPDVFYAAAAALSPGQLAMLKLVSLKDFLLMEPTEDYTYSDALEELQKMVEGGSLDGMSVYSGVDRSIFDTDGIAMTSETMQAIANDEEGAWAKKSERSSIKTGLIIGVAAAGGVGAIAAILTYVAVNKYVTAFVVPTLNITFTELADGSVAIGTEVSSGFWSNFGVALANSGFAAAAFAVTIVAIAVLLIVSCILIILAAIEASEPGEWLSIPRKIMNDVTNSEGGHDYIYYDCIRQAHVDDNGNELGDGKFMDVGNWEDESHYRQWVAVYTTKDPKAGKPIYAKGFGVATGEPNTNVGFLQLKKFNEVKPYDLNTYCSKNKVYMHYKVNTRYTPSTAASVFSQNTAFAFGGCGILIGLLGGLLVGAKSRKKKEANA